MPEAEPPPGEVDLVVTLTKPQLLQLLVGKGLDEIEISGDVSVLQSLVSVVDTVDPNFAIVTP